MVVGANGCGKSTLIRCLAGLATADAGSVQLDGPVGLVFQNPDHQVRVDWGFVVAACGVVW